MPQKASSRRPFRREMVQFYGDFHLSVILSKSRSSSPLFCGTLETLFSGNLEVATGDALFRGTDNNGFLGFSRIPENTILRKLLGFSHRSRIPYIQIETVIGNSMIEFPPVRISPGDPHSAQRRLADASASSNRAPRGALQQSRIDDRSAPSPGILEDAWTASPGAGNPTPRGREQSLIPNCGSSL